MSTVVIPKRKQIGFANGYRRSAGLSSRAKYENDPNGWIEKFLGETLWSRQREINNSVALNRYTAVRSAHDTGKSFDLSRLAAWWIDVKPDPFVVTTAPTWKQVNSILWREMRRAHRKGQLPGRINLDAEWYMGTDELVAFGRKPADYDQAAFQGIHALNVLVLIDEACGVPRGLYDAADSLATNKRARVVAIGNPDDPSSHFEEVCRPGSGWNVIGVSAFDTPAFTGEEVPEYLLDLLVSPEWVEERKKRWGERSPTYISKVKGEFPDIGDDTLLSPRMLRDAQEREILPSPNAVPSYGADISRFGDAKSVIAKAVGPRVRVIDEWEMAATTVSTGHVLACFRNERRALESGGSFWIDVVGVGGGVYDQAVDAGLSVVPYHGGEAPVDSDRFFNKRAEDYWHLREIAEAGELDLPEFGEDDELITQLGSIKWKLSPKGKIMIESKEDMRKRGLPSPDRADAVAMAMSEGATFFVPDRAREAAQRARDAEPLAEDLATRPM